MLRFIKDTFHGSTATLPKRASLLGLPLELRRRIYALTIPHDGLVEPEPKANCVVSIRDDAIANFVLLPPLAQVNRQLRHECAMYFFDNNTFVVAFNRYFREYGRWLWKVEPLWPYLRTVVLQLDSPAARARKENGQALEARMRCEQQGHVVRLSANLKLQPSDQGKVAEALRSAYGGKRVEVFDGRALVAMTKWLMDNVFVGDLLPSVGSASTEWDARTVTAS